MKRFRSRFPHWFRSIAAMILATSLSSTVASADLIPYQNAGTHNSTVYTFTAAATGDLIAYIVGGFSAGYENELGLLVNGVDTGIYGLNNHTSSVGDSLNFGSVNAGDLLVFVLRNVSLGLDAFSDPSLNGPYDDPGSPIHNHVYSTDYTATNPIFPGVPVGTYVAFEDLQFPNSDFNYDDESFVFTNVVADPSNSVPEPASLLLLGTGLAGILIRRKRNA